jgi:hypothetical protein
VAWAKSVGPNTEALVNKIFETRPHPTAAFQSSLGLMRLRDDFPPERIERACTRALQARTYSRKSVLHILKRKLEDIDEAEPPTSVLPSHRNIRGAGYYH